MNIMKGFVNRLPALIRIDSPEHLLAPDLRVIAEWRRRAEALPPRTVCASNFKPKRKANVAELRIKRARG